MLAQTILLWELEGRRLMSTGLRVLLIIVLVSFGSAIVAVLVQECADLPDSMGRLKEERRLAEELNQRQKLTYHRINVKNQTVLDLLDGRLTLVQAAARFRDLEETAGDTSTSPVRSDCAAADGERWCREVIHWFHEQLRWSDPVRADEMAASLETELWYHQSPDGTIALPADSAR